MPKISAVGLFCLYKFENNQTRMCTTFFRMSYLTEPYFNPDSHNTMRVRITLPMSVHRSKYDSAKNLGQFTSYDILV